MPRQTKEEKDAAFEARMLREAEAREVSVTLATPHGELRMNGPLASVAELHDGLCARRSATPSDRQPTVEARLSRPQVGRSPVGSADSTWGCAGAHELHVLLHSPAGMVWLDGPLEAVAELHDAMCPFLRGATAETEARP